MSVSEKEPITEPKVRITLIGGNCPVQAEGTIDDEPFYFRARGSRWFIGIGGEPDDTPDWSRERCYGNTPFAAGWMDLVTARALIYESARLFHASSAR